MMCTILVDKMCICEKMTIRDKRKEILRLDAFLKIVLTVLLAVIGFFLMQTFTTIKNLEKDIITIREKIITFEATRLTRKDIMAMISDYHTNHPCYIIHKKKDIQ